MWFLIATCDVPDRRSRDPDGFLGVDLGIVNIATTSDGARHCGKGLNAVRHRHRELRRRLQAKRTKSAKRLLKQRRRKEARFAANTNHIIAKQDRDRGDTHRAPASPWKTSRASGTGYGSASPSGSRCTPGASTSSGGFIAYKAARAGVAVVYVDPAYTSQAVLVLRARGQARTGPTRPPSPVRRAASLSTPTSTRPATSPHAV